MTPQPKSLTHFLGNCRDCGYPLVRLQSHRCPECGREFKPEDPRTMDFGRSRLADFLKKPTTVWSWLPSGLLIAAAVAGQLAFPRTDAAAALILVAILVTLSTLYISSARTRFRRFLRRHKREKR